MSEGEKQLQGGLRLQWALCGGREVSRGPPNKSAVSGIKFKMCRTTRSSCAHILPLTTNHPVIRLDSPADELFLSRVEIIKMWASPRNMNKITRRSHRSARRSGGLRDETKAQFTAPKSQILRHTHQADVDLAPTLDGSRSQHLERVDPERQHRRGL